MLHSNAMHTFFIRTFGCQMNKHDSERVAGLLSARGMQPVETAEEADVVVFMTCCVRENADERLRGQVRSLKSVKAGRNGQLIAVGGCIGQRDGAKLLLQIPHIDVVFGTHNVGHLPDLLETVQRQSRPQVEIVESADSFTSDLPTQREHPWHAWVPITIGCNNFCTYCVVPYVRGRERSRRLEDVVTEVERLVADGVLEVTLLGQNVNSYGRDLYGQPRFAEILRAVAATGIPRIRFTTSHPKDLSDETITAMSELPAVMPYLHLPVQSGSDRVLSAMNRRYTQAEYLARVGRIREAIPGLALSSDIIVGFPGETEEDFQATLDVVSAVRYDQTFTFIYSPREGTPAAAMEEQVPRDIAQTRFDRLIEIVQRSALENNLVLVGSTQQVLVEGSSRRDALVLAGRTPTNKMVHVPVPLGHSASEFAGRLIDVEIEQAQTWFLSGRLSGTDT
ncbi:MAG: tRNA (N6-isopentenyl adenosine(37)-C2)-methylthiotransferase MiaB [Coriobacteriia bacterium]|nr:tRNA (N6-isopentenyl adenosine(37)-C2)-methylthiotransferase MiaB [Coriobacteriia bacterium]